MNVIKDKVRIFHLSDNEIWLMPGFRHETGDAGHHMSMMRTVDVDEDGDYIPGTGPSNLRFWLHEFLDDYFFYPTQRWMLNWMGNNKIEHIFRMILGFFWGLNCGFPPRDVALYTVWTMRSCPPIFVYEKIDGEWVPDLAFPCHRNKT